MGFNTGKVLLVLTSLIVAGLVYIFTQKDMIDAVAIAVADALKGEKIEVSEVKAQATLRVPKVLQVEKPTPKSSARFAFHYQLWSAHEIVTHAETVNWKVVSLDSQQVTWESDLGWIEAYSRNPFLPPLNATTSRYQPIERRDYLSEPDIFPVSNIEPKVIRVQDRTVSDSRPYEWSCLITGQENLSTMGGEFPVQVITCMVRGGQSGTETFKYSKAHGHWIYRERTGFGQPKLTVELVSYQDE